MINSIQTDMPILINNKLPLDPRQIQETLTDLDDLVSNNQAYESLKVYVKSEKKWYEYDGISWGEVKGNITIVDVVEKDNSNAVSSKGVFTELYTEETVTIIDTEEGYIACQSTDGGALEVVDDSVTPTSTQVQLSVVQAFVPTAQVGEYYQYQPEVSHEETINKTTYIPRTEGYTKEEVDEKFDEIGQLELMEVEEMTDYMDNLVITASGYIPPTQG